LGKLFNWRKQRVNEENRRWYVWFKINCKNEKWRQWKTKINLRRNVSKYKIIQNGKWNVEGKTEHFEIWVLSNGKQLKRRIHLNESLIGSGKRITIELWKYRKRNRRCHFGTGRRVSRWK
jgi:hypothetical protein